MEASWGSQLSAEELERQAEARMRRAGVGPVGELETAEPLSFAKVGLAAAALLAAASVAARVQAGRPEVDLSDGVSMAEIAAVYSTNEGVWNFDNPHQ